MRASRPHESTQRLSRTSGGRSSTPRLPSRWRTERPFALMRSCRVRDSTSTTSIKVIDHAEKYVDGQIHTNGCENFWSLLKRSINGTYVSIEPFHLFRYLDEQAFRYNNRKGMNDGDRFDLVVRQIVGKRLTFDQLTGKVAQA